MKRTIVVDKLPITFNEINGIGPTCILVHGAGANRNYWKSLSEKMSGRHMLCPDLYGHGETPAWNSVARNTRSYSYRDDVPLIAAIASDRTPPFDLIGHSSGGSVCLEFARSRPDWIRRVVLIEPMLPTVLRNYDAEAWAEVSTAYESVHEKVNRGLTQQAAHDLFEYILGDGQWNALPEKIREWMSKNVETTLAAHSAASLTLPTETKEYASVSAPTLIIYGEKTRKPYVQIAHRLSEVLQDSRLEKVDGASHNSPLTHSHPVNSLIVDFIGRS